MKKIYYLWVMYPLMVHLVSKAKNVDEKFTPYELLFYKAGEKDDTLPYPAGMDELLNKEFQEEYDVVEVFVCERNCVEIEEDGVRRSFPEGWLNLKEYVDAETSR